MKKHLSNYLVVACLSFVSLSASLRAEKHDSESLSYTVTEVSDNLKLLQGKGGNIALLTGKDGLLMVDADYAVMSDALIKTLGDFGGTEQLRNLINTHWHGDHTEGNKALGGFCRIIAHDNVRQRLSERQEVKLFGMVSEPYSKPALPSITYASKMHLHINDEDIEIIHLPGGHTDSDSIVYFKQSNVIHLGDHFFNGFYPFVDVDNGGDVYTVARNLETVLPLMNEKTVLIPGHGPVGYKPDVESFIAMLDGTLEEVKAKKASGMSLEEIQKQGLDEKWKEWADGFLSSETWISILYSSIK